MVICDNSICDHAVVTGASGSFRFLAAQNNFGIVAGPNAGTFYTDAHGMKPMAADEPGAVRQFVKPGVSLAVPNGGGTAGHCFDLHAWGKPFTCSVMNSAPWGQATNREGSIQAPN